jgi:hypothetical protein
VAAGGSAGSTAASDRSCHLGDGGGGEEGEREEEKEGGRGRAGEGGKHFTATHAVVQCGWSNAGRSYSDAPVFSGIPNFFGRKKVYFKYICIHIYYLT